MTDVRTEAPSKIGPRHLDRRAYVYVRQSSPRQVRQHGESRRRQYQMVDWVERMGWSKDRVVVIDEDQAHRRYDEVDPANRLVARELERRWEEALAALRHTEQEAEDDLRSRESPLSREDQG